MGRARQVSFGVPAAEPTEPTLVRTAICSYHVIMKIDRRLARLRVRDMEHLVAITEAGSLRKAAKASGVSQPTLSKTLREIEDAFGAALFERSRTGLVPTAAGSHAAAAAEALLSELGRTRDELLQRRQIPFRIGCTPVFSMTILSGWLEKLRDSQTVVVEAPVPELLEGLGRGQLDAVVASYPDADYSSDAFAHRVLFKEKVRIIASPSMKVGNSWEALSKVDWALPPRISLLRRVVDARFLAEGLPPPRPKIESMNVPTNLRLVLAGLAVGAVPESYLRHYTSEGELRFVRARPLPEFPPVSFIFRRNTARHPQTERALRALVCVLPSSR